MADLEISKMLTVSTAHLSQDTAEKLPPDASDVDNDDYQHVWGPAFARDGGWLFYVPSEKGQLDTVFEHAPKDLIDVVLFTHVQGCIWLLFDRDGPLVEGLFAYDW